MPLSCRPVVPLILSACPKSKFILNVNVDMITCYSLILDPKSESTEAVGQFPISE